MKVKITLILLLIVQMSIGQTFEKSFEGWWADTNWTFVFNKNGTFKRISNGHYGNTVVEGQYKINGDTITILSGFEKTDGTVNQTYLLDKYNMLIDADLRYDYKPITRKQEYFYNSKIRNIKYPQTLSKDKNKIKELEKVLNLTLNNPTVKQYYHFDNLDRKLIIANYFNLSANIQVDNNIANFLPQKDIKNQFYLEFIDINQNKNSIVIEMKIHGEGVTIWFVYNKLNGEWIEEKPVIIEN